MSYQALYRKFRPQEFDDVKGQDHIVTTLKNQIKADRIGHAYLFCGTRGTGKTTIAKIFAKAVNCEHPVDGSPCGECPTCRAIAAGNSMNVIEIDAASNNGVDNIRQIREEVEYRPTEGKYKVYIIDEVHMLSIGAFNALLKTLEEPPAYVIFILATTEAHKIPITILSRCQRYDFRRISIDTITARLRELMDAEQVTVEDRALRYIAKAGDGSMRDALSLLDQCIAFYLGQELTYDKVLDTLGAVDTEIFSRLLRQILDKNITGAIQTVETLVIEGRELGQFVTDFTWYLRNLLLVKSSDNMEDVLDAVVMGRACRNEAAIKNRQPISRMYIKSDFTLSEFYQEIIEDELNVKEVVFTDDVRDFTSYTFKPQLRTVGPKYGKQLGGIQKHLAALDGNAAMDELNADGALKFDVDGVAVELTKDDLLIDMAQKEGYVSQEDNRMTVVLDTNLTPELVEEGFVYEIISKIQTMRKESGFEVTDHIRVSINGNDKLSEIAQKNKEAISGKVLADELTSGMEYGVSKEWNINGENAVIAVERV